MVRPYRNLNSYWNRQFDKTDWTKKEIGKVYRKSLHGET